MNRDLIQAEDPGGNPSGVDILERLYAVIRDRRDNPRADSYVCLLFSRGVDKILAKIGEEATETVIAGKGGDKQEIVHEAADLIFHLLVLLGLHDINPDRIWEELSRRCGISGLEEKRSRSPSVQEES